MSKIVIFSDLHAHAFKPYATLLPNGRNSRLQDAANCIAQIREHAVAVGADLVLFGGDMFHVRKHIPVAVFNLIYEEMAKFSLEKIPITMIHGNHDQADRVGEDYSIYAFSAFSNVMDKPGWLAVDGASRQDRIGILGVPYIEDLDQLRAAADLPAPSDVTHKIFMGHFGLQGAKIGADFVYPGQYDAQMTDIGPERFDATFLGHFHLYQQMGAAHENTHFIGAPIQHNWGDRGQQRGFLIYDTETRTHERVALELPQFIELTEQDVEEADLHSAPPCVADSYVRIAMDKPWGDADREKFRKHHQLRSVECFRPTMAKQKNAGPRMPVEPTMAAQDVVATYVRSGIASTEGLDENYLLQIANEVMQEVEEAS